LGKSNARFSPQAAFLRSLTGEEKSNFALCAELAEAGKLVNLKIDISKLIFFRICGISLVLSGTWTQAGNVTAKVTVLAYQIFFLYIYIFF
jgi:hypothetical protein